MTSTINQDHRHHGERNMSQALRRGFMRRCPSCGQGALFRRYVKTVDACAHCGEEIHHHRADDFPAYLVILIVGHLVVPLFMTVNIMTDLPLWLNFIIWFPVTTLACLALLEPVKGAVVAMQWALRMHGFGGKADTPADDPELSNAPSYSSGV